MAVQQRMFGGTEHAAWLQKEIDRLWENGVLNEDKVSSWSDEHMRTPYNVLRTVSFPHVEVKRLDEFQRELE